MLKDNLVAQVINLSNQRSFKYYKEKYNYSIIFYPGLYGIELRNISSELSNREINTKTSNIYYLGNDMLLTGSFKEIIDNLLPSLEAHTLNLEIFKAIKNYEKNEVSQYEIGKRKFEFKFAYVMGILNVTPDSFSDGGQFVDTEKAVNYALEMIKNGVDIIDIGGESTRPGSESVSEAEEIKRVIPVISGILNKSHEAIISIDTTKTEVAKEALKSGALIVNDISGGTFEPDIFNAVAEFNAAVILMHIKGKPETMQASPVYVDVVSEVYDYLTTQSAIASDHGIKNIIIDPGIGFGKRVEDNLTLIARLEDFKSLGYPIMIGLSRKSFIGNILNLPVEDRDDASNALNSYAIGKGARIIRTHNVKYAVQTCKLFNNMIKN